MLGLYVRAMNALDDRDDEGQTTMEFLGICVLIIVVITVAMAAVKANQDTFTAGVKTVVDRVFNLAPTN